MRSHNYLYFTTVNLSFWKDTATKQLNFVTSRCICKLLYSTGWIFQTLHPICGIRSSQCAVNLRWKSSPPTRKLPTALSDAGSDSAWPATRTPRQPTPGMPICHLQRISIQWAIPSCHFRQVDDHIMSVCLANWTITRTTHNVRNSSR